MNNESFITDKINKIFSASQEFLRPIVSASLFLQRFDYFIMLLLILLYLSSLFATTNILGFIALLIIILTILKLFFIRGQKIEIYPSSIILTGFLAICFISVLFSQYPKMSFLGFAYYSLYISFYFSVIHFFRYNRNKIVPIIFVIMFLITLESLYSVIQSFHPIDAIATWQDTSYINEEDILARVYGTLKPYNPNLLCGYLITGLSSIFTVGFWAIIKKHKKTFIFAVTSFIITLIAILKTGTRGGYMGIFIMLVAAFLLINIISKDYFSKKAHELWKKICVSFAILGGVIVICTPAIFKRILSIFMFRADSSTSFRMNVYKSTLEMFKDNWFTGIGSGHDTFRNLYGLYMTTGFDALSAYSIYLEIAVEGGIFALLFFLSFFVMLFQSGIKFTKSNFQIEQKIIVISTLIMITGVFVHGFVDTIFFRPQLQFLFWTNIAILSVILEENDNESNLSNNFQQIVMNLSNFIENKIRRD